MSPRPPSGTPPPVLAELGGQPIDLAALAAEICERYHAHYTDEEERHGPAGRRGVATTTSGCSRGPSATSRA